MFAQAVNTRLEHNVGPKEASMPSLETYPPVDWYVAARMSHLPQKAHAEDFAIALNLDESSIAEYASRHALFQPHNVIRRCDLQLSLADDILEQVIRLQETHSQINTMIERLAHAYKLGLPAHTFLG